MPTAPPQLGWSPLPGPSNILVPSHALDTLMNDYERFEKAADRNGNLTNLSNDMKRQIGSLFSYFQVLSSNIAMWGAYEKPQMTPSHRFLRQAARKSLIDGLLINARCFQVRQVAQVVAVEGREKGFQVVHRRAQDPTFTASKDVIRRCHEMEDFITGKIPGRGINREFHPNGIQDFLVKATRGQLTIDRTVMVIQRDGSGRPLSFHLLPPDDIKPRMEVLLSFMPQLGATSQRMGLAARQVATINLIWDKYQVDLTDKAYVQEIDLQVLGAWKSSEISVSITNPSDELNMFGYGESCLQGSLEATTMLLYAMSFNKQMFTANFPEAVLVLKGNPQPADVLALQRQFSAEVGPQAHNRLPIISGGEVDGKSAELLKLRDTMRDLQFLQLLRTFISLKASAYRATPHLLNFAPDQGRERPAIVGEKEDSKIAMAEEQGFGSLLDSFARWMTDELITPVYDDLKMSWSVRDQPTDKERIEIQTMQAALSKTVDEIRAKDGDPPLAEVTDGEVSGGYVNSPMFFQARMAKQADEQMQQPQPEDETAFSGMQPGPGMGAPGQPGKPPMPGRAAPPNGARSAPGGLPNSAPAPPPPVLSAARPVRKGLVLVAVDDDEEA